MPGPSNYREFAPPPHLAAYIERFWTHAPRSTPGRVVPDTCVDLIFSPETGLRIVGSMTRPFMAPANCHPLFGVRLRAGAVQSMLPLPIAELRDAVVPLSELVGDAEQLSVESILAAVRPLTAMQQAIGYLAAHGGKVRLDDIARISGVSLRQFRRHCVEQTGLSPKTLARISRFRHAWQRSLDTPAPNWPDIALDCGYYDQAHLVNDFVEFSGVSPAAFRRSREA